MVIPPFVKKISLSSFLIVSSNDVRQGLTFCPPRRSLGHWFLELRHASHLCWQEGTFRKKNKKQLAPNPKPKVGSFRQSKLLFPPWPMPSQNKWLSDFHRCLQVDPEGHFVRRWLPELRHLPTEYIHCPWVSWLLLGEPVQLYTDNMLIQSTSYMFIIKCINAFTNIVYGIDLDVLNS